MINNDEMRKLEKDLRDVFKNHNLSFNENFGQIYKALYEKEHEKRILEICASHKALVGKCYKRFEEHNSDLELKTYKYYKVISERSINQDHVSALVFFDRPYYWFNNLGFSHLGNVYFGNFLFSFVDTEELFVPDIEDMEEVSLEEYNDAMRKLTEQVIELE